MREPPFSASSLLSASSSPSSPTHGPQVVNQKLTTVTALPEKSSSLVTSFPSRSLPTKEGNFCMLLLSLLLSGSMLVSPEMFMLPSAGTLMAPSRDSCAASGYFFSIMVSLLSMSRIFSASPRISFSSSAVNWSLADSMVSSRKSP